MDKYFSVVLKGDYNAAVKAKDQDEALSIVAKERMENDMFLRSEIIDSSDREYTVEDVKDLILKEKYYGKLIIKEIDFKDSNILVVSEG